MERVWPNAETRENDMVDFAKRHLWRLHYYQRDYIAIFDKQFAT